MRFILLALVAACNAKPAVTKAQIDQATIVTKKYAYEAYPSWSVAHPDKACPGKLAELDEFMAKDAGKPDPWGGAYVMLCGKDLPAGAKGFAVFSPGPDGKPNTDDDLKSW